MIRGVLLFLWALSASAQADFPFRDFSSTASLRMAGVARPQGKALRLTGSEKQTAGAAWFERKRSVAAGFDTSFRFQLTGQGGLGPGADGFAFVLQNSGIDALGERGSAGGFALGDPRYYGKGGGIPQSIAIFFDTYQNREARDPSDNYIAICTAGTPQKMHWPPPRLTYTKNLSVRLKDGAVHGARILFQPPILTVYLDDRDVLTSTIDLATVVDSTGAAYVGFTASTGGGYENHDILDWSFAAPDVSSSISLVSSSISFLKTACLPDRNLCTPERALVEATGEGTYHVVLPANVEWGAAVPNPAKRKVTIENERGMVCWDLQGLGSQGCNGPAGNWSGAGKLVMRFKSGRTWFSVDDRTGKFGENEGYFEFDVRVQ
jgi:Legume lectin domain